MEEKEQAKILLSALEILEEKKAKATIEDRINAFNEAINANVKALLCFSAMPFLDEILVTKGYVKI